MSLIQYRQATYANQLRDELEIAGCQPKVAAIVSRTVGDLIEYVTHTQADARRDLEHREFNARQRGSELNAARNESFDRFIGVTIFIMTAAIVCGVLIALFR